ncbi:hypothetical protein [Luteipulveratus halotolerans]|uniref:Uncharacterized protein n=1 Tax=Luteipulveratus halotolerans TaxID=1631356 RepID=A0A0L6CGR3_9MICO|nr:hypothetical protein [Luteipulveratus halotolerans]KNX36986.1 hypothetical protein VV01_07205 [Luteipulveratus halotolerans]
MAANTTIKVTRHARDRINDRARAHGVTPAVLLERMLDEHDRAERFAAVKAAYAALPADDDYAGETAEWDAAGEDGLAGA